MSFHNIIQPSNPVPSPLSDAIGLRAEEVNPATQEASPSVVDPEVLATISRGSKATLDELIELFQRTVDQDSIELMKAVNKRDAAAVTHAAHRIRGAAALLGAFNLATFAERIEGAGRSADWQIVLANTRLLEQEFRRVNIYLASL